MFPQFLTICLIFCETLIFDLDIGSHNVALVLSREVFLCCWFLASMKNGICVFGSWQHSRRVFLSLVHDITAEGCIVASRYHSRRMCRCLMIAQQKDVLLVHDITAEGVSLVLDITAEGVSLVLGSTAEKGISVVGS